MAKKTARRKVAKKADKYHASYPDTLMMLVIESGNVNKRGEIAWSRMAKVFKVSPRTLERWRDPSDKDNYKPKFAQAAKEAQDAAYAAKIKRSMIDRAIGYTQTKKMTEMRDTPDGEITVHRTEKTTMAGDPTAAKLVLANMGPVEERWCEKHKHEIEPKTLADIAAIVGADNGPGDSG